MDVKAKSDNGGTILQWTAGAGNEAVVRQLIDKGPGITAKDNLGRTALHWAAEEGHEAVAHLLRCVPK
jgi:ankyrin repeat protein